MTKRLGLVFLVVLAMFTGFWFSRNHAALKENVPNAPTAEGQSTPVYLGLSRDDGDDAKARESSRHAEGDVQVEKAIRHQEAKVREQKKLLFLVVQTKGIVYLKPDGSPEPPNIPEVDLSEDGAAKRFYELETQKMQIEGQVNSLKKYEGEQLLVFAAGLEVQDHAVKPLYGRFLDARRALESLKYEGLGADHPTVKEKAAEVVDLKAQCDEAVAKVRESLLVALGEVSKSMDEFPRVDPELLAKADKLSYAEVREGLLVEQRALETLKLKLDEQKRSKDSR